MTTLTPIGTTLHLNGVQLSDFGARHHRWVLWHATGRCNIECSYCYGSFVGGSYKRNFRLSDDVPLPSMLQAASDIAELGFDHVHINGGEALLRRDLWQLIDRLVERHVKVWLLTNGTFVPSDFDQHFVAGRLECVAFSLDSLHASYGDQIRERTDVVISTIERTVRLRKEHRLATRLGLYVVLTRENHTTLTELFDWAVDLGIDYINMQAIYLPKAHPMAERLVFRESDAAEALRALEQLKKRRDVIRTSSDTLMELTRRLISGNRGVVARRCFAEVGDYLYIGPTGDVFGCPSKPRQSNRVWGNINGNSLKEIVGAMRTASERNPVCPHVSLDCLGMYEMAFQNDYVTRSIGTLEAATDLSREPHKESGE